MKKPRRSYLTFRLYCLGALVVCVVLLLLHDVYVVRNDEFYPVPSFIVAAGAWYCVLGLILPARVIRKFETVDLGEFSLRPESLLLVAIVVSGFAFGGFLISHYAGHPILQMF